MGDRPRGGRRHEDYPDVVRRDKKILSHLGRAGYSRNQLAAILREEPRKISYALHRLRDRGMVTHVPRGNEGHGYWIKTNPEEASMIEYRDRLWSQLGIDHERLDRDTFDSFMNEYDASLADGMADMVVGDELVARYTVVDASGLRVAPLHLIAKKIRESKTGGKRS